jgi:hypothetical protein
MNNPNSIGWGSTKIQYVIMTDSEGVKWKVPTHIDDEPFEYLVKYNPEECPGTFQVHPNPQPQNTCKS